MYEERLDLCTVLHVSVRRPVRVHRCVRAWWVKPLGNSSRGPLLLSGLKLQHNPQGQQPLDGPGVV